MVYSPGIPVRGAGGFRVGFRLSVEARRLLTTMDVVHVDDPFGAGRLAIPICKRHHIPVVYTNHTRVDLYPYYYLKAMPQGSLDVPVSAYMRRFCRKTDLVISPTASMESVLRDVGVDVPIAVVRNGVDISRFSAAASDLAGHPEEREARRRAFGIDDSVRGLDVPGHRAHCAPPPRARGWHGISGWY
jgi:glycosyltransferase involved in cell wall biosynthesis